MLRGGLGGDCKEKVRWGDVGIVPNLGVRHLTFSSEDGVRKPAFGKAYAGVGEEKVS